MEARAVAALAIAALAIAALAIAALWSSQSLAQSASPLSNTELSEETENPVTRLITLPLRYQADFLDGADKLTKSTFELDQAVVPFRLNEDWSLITRTKLPAEALPIDYHVAILAERLANGLDHERMLGRDGSRDARVPMSLARFRSPSARSTAVRMVRSARCCCASRSPPEEALTRPASSIGRARRRGQNS